MSWIKYNGAVAGLLLAGFNSMAQDSGLGSWNIINLKYNQDQKWSAFTEMQVRSLKLYDDFHYYELTGGLNYQINPTIRITVAGGTHQTYAEGGTFIRPKNADEVRLWPQVTLSQPIGRFKIEHRYRAEFRFTDKGYRNRFRYRLAAVYPLGKPTQGFQPFQLAISNEIFMRDTAPYFERNRFILALYPRLSKEIYLLVGYLYQYDYRLVDEIGRDFLTVGLFFEFFGSQWGHQH
jgi:hypothetical protein